MMGPIARPPICHANQNRRIETEYPDNDIWKDSLFSGDTQDTDGKVFLGLYGRDDITLEMIVSLLRSRSQLYKV